VVLILAHQVKRESALGQIRGVLMFAGAQIRRYGAFHPNAGRVCLRMRLLARPPNLGKTKTAGAPAGFWAEQGMIMGPRGVIGLGLLLALAGCEGQDPLSLLRPAPDVAEAEATPASGETRDVEAPEIFSRTDAGLWDGRPSLGGVWVAFPDVAEPERVIIRNTVTGSSVIGALFRRERDNPGPRFQISSDAAEALNILAGEPTRIEVVALKRETVATAPEATETDDPTPVESVDPSAIAAAAIEAAELEEPGTAPVSPPPAASASASPLSRPYIQIGIFNVADNAEAAKTQMRAAGLAADTTTQESQGKTFYRVIVGPAQTETARAAALETVRGLGFADAYFVSN